MSSERRLDPDRLLALEEERDFLLRSLDDLEAEREANDIDDADYRELKDDYTVRAADAIRRLDRHQSDLADARSSRGSGRLVAWVIGLCALAIAAGVLLARASGERGVDDQITGSIEESVRDQVLRCQQLGTQPDLLLDSLTCFDEVLDRDPRNVEALTYRGWYVVLASGTAEQAGESDAAAELLSVGFSFLERAVVIDPAYPDARAFRAIVFERLGQSESACAELDVLSGGDTPPMIAQLVEPLSERLSC